MPLVLSLVLALSLLLRISFTGVSPPELFGDEIDIGYQAYSLLKTGRDLYGQILPTYVHSLSEWRLPLLMYATIPSIALFGNSEMGVRLPEIIFGSLAPIVLYTLAYHTTRSKPISLLSSFSLALMPWHIHYSRTAFEVVVLLDLVMLGTLLYLKDKHRISGLLFALTFYTYSTAVVFVPLWLGFLIFFSRRKLPSLSASMLFVAALLPFSYHLITGTAGQRFGVVSIFKNQEIIGKINSLRLEDNRQMVSFWHNKAESFAQALVANYLHPFSSEFLFVRGDPVFRHSPQIIGQLLPLTAPFVALGLFYLARRKKWLWLVWLLLAPLPSIFTADGGYHATRLFFLVAPLSVATASGIYLLARKFPKVWPLLIIPALLQFFWFGHYYLVHYPRVSWRWWHAGFKQALSITGRLSDKYNYVFINNSYEPSLIRFLFYSSYPPALFHNQFVLDQPQKNIVPGYDGFSLGSKYYFGNFNSPEWTRSLRSDSIYLVSQRDNVGGDWDWRKSPPADIQVLYTSTNSYDQPILYWVTRK